MNSETIEIYHPRGVSNLGQWDIGGLKLKVYGLVADNRKIDEPMATLAQSFVRQEVLPRVADEGDENGMGFVIIHPGELGVSILAHWWIQGSVLCQHIYRKLYSATEPMDTVKRPVIACVWELALMNAEQEAWRKTMMKGEPNPLGYMGAWADFEAA
ncbi:hypothetical protein EOA22_02715 [Mesorhizobium sp. M7A.F.Ca.US.014.04.1.1]|uniref:Uncharacterized protein n=1 Tax=Mesorhizobium ciceri biovar biserrulae (strain HAMBI 2942 / LMG 23838 / WSM1271) TaxID=765698 RepID=E8TNG5_MESCW|nr:MULTISPECIES: hypothetical protein [Mesorhizobium]ADV12847.1 hypothetical protein Mesci_3728 [Mesorhizobium ciceri biovar biserrulae WSM1271]AMX93031.1 hypothetical protein A4R28_07965 [Mesorhizobium ciceri]MBZ9888861.1 hypothetical protein [Mesorhizobium sp. BR1-1-3]MDF3211441.1 hypothetical protein [Mesorhizobium sp. LMG15046]MDF3233003.1 hypothetical protein [Mesorhizobium sp. DSM 30133]